MLYVQFVPSNIVRPTYLAGSAEKQGCVKGKVTYQYDST
jgi:hypothetical protein